MDKSLRPDYIGRTGVINTKEEDHEKLVFAIQDVVDSKMFNNSEVRSFELILKIKVSNNPSYNILFIGLTNAIMEKLLAGERQIASYFYAYDVKGETKYKILEGSIMLLN
jgi:hypothetical protein